MRLISLLLPLATLLSACSSHDQAGEANQFCYTIARTGGAATCNSCSQISQAPDAFDGHFSTGAQVAAGGQGVLSGTAAVQPAGRVAGVYFVLPASGSITASISTYLNGVLQETSGTGTQYESGTQTCPGIDCQYRGPDGYISFPTTKQFDRIDATVSNGGVGTVEVRELCVS